MSKKILTKNGKVFISDHKVLVNDEGGEYPSESIAYYKQTRNKDYPYLPLPYEMEEETQDTIYMLYDANGYMCCPVFYITYTNCVVTVQKYMNTTLVSEYTLNDVVSNSTYYMQFSEEDSDYSTYNYIVIKLQGTITRHGLDQYSSFKGRQYDKETPDELIEVSGKCKSCHIAFSRLGTWGQDYYHKRAEYYSFKGDLTTSNFGYGTGLFWKCHNLICVPELDTQHLGDGNSLFKECYSLIAIPNLDLQKATYGTYMFGSCKALNTIPLLDFSKFTSLTDAFNTSGIITLPPIDISNVKDMARTFLGCNTLTTLPQLDMKSVTGMYQTFKGCSNLVKVPNLITENCTDFGETFSGCSALTIVEGLNTSKATRIYSIFEGCTKLISIPQLDTSSATFVYKAFYNCNSLVTPIRLNTNLSGNNLPGTFYNCYNIPRIDITYYNISSTNYIDNFCTNCYSLKDLIIRSFGDNKIVNKSLLSGCYHFTGTLDSRYNPEGLTDGTIYIPRSLLSTLPQESNWLDYTSFMKPIYDVVAFGNGSVTETRNEANETIVNAIPNGNFTGWYKGSIKTNYIPTGEALTSTYENLNTTYTFVLNDSGYYQNNNQTKSNSYAIARFNFNITEPGQILKITYLQEGESSYDFGIIGNIDTSLSKDTSTTGFKILNNTSTPEEILLTPSIGSHFIDIKYKKDGSGDTGTDTLQVKVEVLMTEAQQYVDGELYSTDQELNLGIIDEMTMEPLNLVAVFEPNEIFELPQQNGVELTITQLYNATQNENILEAE